MCSEWVGMTKSIFILGFRICSYDLVLYVAT